MSPAASKAEDLDLVAEDRQAERAAFDQKVDVAGGLLGDALAEEEVRLGDERRDPVVDQLRLDRVVLVHEHVDRGLVGVEAGERLQAVEQVGREDQRCEHLALADHLLGLFARRGVDALDPVAQLGSGLLCAELALAGAEVEALGPLDLVEEGDPRLALVAGEREADEDPDDDRVSQREARRPAASA